MSDHVHKMSSIQFDVHKYIQHFDSFCRVNRNYIVKESSEWHQYQTINSRPTADAMCALTESFQWLHTVLQWLTVLCKTKWKFVHCQINFFLCVNKCKE